MKIIYGLCMAMLFIACNKSDDVDFSAANEPEKSEIFIPEEAFPGVEKELIELPDGGYVEKLDSIYILGKDILLTQEQFDILNTPPQQSRGAINLDPAKKWPWGIVFYNPPLDSSPNKDKIYTAMKSMEINTNIRFWPAVKYHDNYINFIEGDGNWSYIGRVGGKQDLSLYPDYRSIPGTVVHELGHALGLFHEQSRRDRDQYIDIKWSNIHYQEKPNFKTYVENGYNKGIDYLSFDFGSIMLYSSYNSFAIDRNQPTMTKKDGSTFIGQRNRLSWGDIATLRSLYPTPQPPNKEVLYWAYNYRDEDSSWGGTTRSITYVDYVFTSRYPVTENTPISITIIYVSTSRDGPDMSTTYNTTLTIPVGARTVTYTLDRSQLTANQDGWDRTEATLYVNDPDIRYL